VASIGNFDGVHRGHQAVLAQLLEKSRLLQLPVVIVIFEPQPQEFFNKGEAIPARLTRFREKVRYLTEYGADYVLCLPFNKNLSQMPASDFLKKTLIEPLGLRYLIVGEDFRFGRGREGDFALLSHLAAQYHFEVQKAATVGSEGERVSSTRVRYFLLHGQLDDAARLLGRPYSMEGRVVHGNKLGRQLGFPTANVFLHRKRSPLQGIYAVKCYGIRTQVVYGVASVGTRPTVGGTKCLLEVYLFDFNDTIYGKHIRVEFCHKIRDEQKFGSLELLKQEIANDAVMASNYFKNNVIMG
jgi:riboflavin kinase/FMN adenylyltransferase